MVIVVNVKFLEKGPLEGLDGLLKELLLQLINQQAAHQFFLLSDKTLDDRIVLPSNATNIAAPVSKNFLLHKYWLDIKLPLLLKKLGASVYLETEANASSTTKVPQCLLLRDLDLLQPNGKRESGSSSYTRQNRLRSVQKAKSVLVPSAFLQQALVKQYEIPESRVLVLNYAVPKQFAPVGIELKESIKALYTQSQEYFVYKGLIDDGNNLINLLKAFSLFKKRQQSSWKLLLAGTYKEGKNEFPNLLETYKYKEDVFVTGPLNVIEQAEVIGSAYALISPSLSEKVDGAVWEAMQSEVPVIAADTATNREIGQEGFLYFNGNEPHDIAEKMMQIYKDENQRRKLIESGKELVRVLSWDRAVHTLWQGVLLAANA